MDKKGFIDLDEINPIYLVLALVGAVVVWFCMRAMGTGFRIIGTLLGFIVVYIYLAATD